MANRIAIQFGDRKVFWTPSDQETIAVLQALVQNIGPAQEDTDGR